MIRAPFDLGLISCNAKIMLKTLNDRDAAEDGRSSGEDVQARQSRPASSHQSLICIIT